MTNSKSKAKFSISIITLLIAILFLVGCSLETSTDSPVLIKNFDCDMRVASRGRNYLCHLRRLDGSSTLTVKTPKELDGLELEYQGGVYSVTFKGLTMSLDDSKSQLTQYFADGVMKVLDKTFSLESISSSQVDGIWTYDGDTTYGEFELKFDRDGKLLELKIPKLDTEIVFENFSEIG